MGFFLYIILAAWLHRLALRNRGIFEDFKTAHWAFGNTPTGDTRRRRYLRIKTQYEEFLAGRAPEPGDHGDPERGADPQEALEFALEAHLRDFLARNLDRIEAGLRLYTSGDRTAIEFPVDGCRIDLLAVDRTEQFVVIELKLSQGRNKTLGQLLYYMGWVDQHLGNGPCRGLIIASANHRGTFRCGRPCSWCSAREVSYELFYRACRRCITRRSGRRAGSAFVLGQCPHGAPLDLAVRPLRRHRPWQRKEKRKVRSLSGTSDDC